MLCAGLSPPAQPFESAQGPGSQQRASGHHRGRVTYKPLQPHSKRRPRLQRDRGVPPPDGMREIVDEGALEHLGREAVAQLLPRGVASLYRCVHITRLQTVLRVSKCSRQTLKGMECATVKRPGAQSPHHMASRKYESRMRRLRVVQRPHPVVGARFVGVGQRAAPEGVLLLARLPLLRFQRQQRSQLRRRARLLLQPLEFVQRQALQHVGGAWVARERHARVSAEHSLLCRRGPPVAVCPDSVSLHTAAECFYHSFKLERSLSVE